ncbi:EAL domain-containing protein [Paraburkholderia sp. PREW-6R]|uniref:EAL domain-containing protein n=1 Tax=Paraburkholderia sp. PREW-6R TaxID=3141544 RepID=UPI0031F4B56A
MQANSFSDELMAFGSPVTSVRRSTSIAFTYASRRRFAIVLVVCAGSSLAFAGPPEADSSRSLSSERNVWQQMTDWLAGPPAPPIYFGSACVSIAPLPLVPAAIAGPVAGPTPPQAITCDSLDDTLAEATDDAAATDSSVPVAVTLLTQLPWPISAHPVTVAGGPPASGAAIPVVLRIDRVEQSPESPTMPPPDCLQGKGCEASTLPTSIGTGTAASVSPSPSTATQRFPVWNILRFVWWPILLAVLIVVAGWALKKRWFRYDESLLRAARAGLRRGEFHVEYQPIVNVRRRTCAGVEAFLRWDNPQYGALGPAHYMQFIENSSLIGPMTQFVVSRAAQELREIGAPKSLFVAINAPASYLMSSAFIADLGDVGSIGLPLLVLKVGAGSAMKFRKRLTPIMAQARNRGLRFALSATSRTDVGPELPADMRFEMVKIDREVLAMDADERSRQLSALTSMGHEMGAMVVVEGIEHAAHHNIARASLAEFGQGFFYSRALGASGLKAFLGAANAPSSAEAGAWTTRGWWIRHSV